MVIALRVPMESFVNGTSLSLMSAMGFTFFQIETYDGESPVGNADGQFSGPTRSTDSPGLGRPAGPLSAWPGVCQSLTGWQVLAEHHAVISMDPAKAAS